MTSAENGSRSSTRNTCIDFNEEDVNEEDEVDEEKDYTSHSSERKREFEQRFGAIGSGITSARWGRD
jgi:hypothetical protein